MYRVKAPAIWTPGTVIHYATASAGYDGTYLVADTEDALKNIMAAFGLSGEIDEYVEGTDEDHNPPPPPPPVVNTWVPAPDQNPVEG